MSTEFLYNLRKANIERDKEMLNNLNVSFSLSFRGNELAGETGEVCNILKKLDREKLGVVGSRATKEQLIDELADVIICIDLIAMDLDIDLISGIIKKFNKTSEERRLEVKLQNDLEEMKCQTPYKDHSKFNSKKCPYNGPTCTLISNGQKEFACKTCGTGFSIISDNNNSRGGKLTPFDWHGEYPWEKKEEKIIIRYTSSVGAYYDRLHRNRKKR